MSLHRLVVLLGALALILVACGEDDGPDADNDAVDVDALIETAAAELESTRAFEIVLEAEGAPVLLSTDVLEDFDLPVEFRRAQGVYVAPDRLGGVVTLRIQDASTDADVVVIDDDQYVRHILITLNNWQALIFSEGFNPRNLTAGEQSIPAALRDIQNAEYLGREELDGLEMHHIRGEVAAVQVSAATVGLIGTEEGLIEAELFIRPSDGRLEQLRLQEPPLSEGADATQWTVGFFSYGEDFTVNRPDTAE